MENNSVIRSSTNTSTSPTMTDTPSKAQGRAMVTAVMFESAIIVMGNMLVIILFVREKKLRKKNALLFVSAISVLSWLPLVIVNYLVFVQGVDIPRRFLLVDIINILNLSNSILNPFVYALRIPEFRQALRVSCCSPRQDVMNRPGIVRSENMAAVLTPVLQRRAIQWNSSQVHQIYGKEVTDTKL